MKAHDCNLDAPVALPPAPCWAGRSESSADSVLWFSVNVWHALKRLTESQMKEAVMEADKVLEMHPPFSKLSVEIPHFGLCGYAKCAAIAAVFICSRAKTDHVDSPILAAARDAKILAELSPCGFANLGIDTQTFK